MTALTESDRRWIRCASVFQAAVDRIIREPGQTSLALRTARDLIRRYAGPMELPGRWYELLSLAEVANVPTAELADDLWTLATRCLAETERTA
jgi:hypothetical protein